MGMTVRMDIGRFKEQLRAEVDKLHAAPGQRPKREVK